MAREGLQCSPCVAAHEALGTLSCIGMREGVLEPDQAAGVGGSRAPGKWRAWAGLCRVRGEGGAEVQGEGFLSCRQSQAGAAPFPLPSHSPCTCPVPPGLRGRCARPLPGLSAAPREAEEGRGAALTMVPMLYVAAGPMVWW